MVAGTFHVPSAIQKPLDFEATAHGVCLLLSSSTFWLRHTECVRYFLALLSGYGTRSVPATFPNDPQRLNGNVNNGDCLLVDSTSSLDSSSNNANVDLVSASRSSM